MPKSFFGGALICPKCRSKDVEIGSASNKYSVGKGLVGAALVGPIGLVAGAAGKKGKTTCHCRNCGKVWEEKL